MIAERLPRRVENDTETGRPADISFRSQELSILDELRVSDRPSRHTGHIWQRSFCPSCPLIDPVGRHERLVTESSAERLDDDPSPSHTLSSQGLAGRSYWSPAPLGRHESKQPFNRPYPSSGRLPRESDRAHGRAA